MYQNYLITGATGFLGSAVVQLLLAHGCRVLALVKDRDPLIYTLPNHVAVFYGDLTDKESLRDFVAAGGDDFCVLHCAGLISIASKPDEALYAVDGCFSFQGKFFHFLAINRHREIEYNLLYPASVFSLFREHFNSLDKGFHNLFLFRFCCGMVDFIKCQ